MENLHQDSENKLFITNISNRVSKCTIYELLVQASRVRGLHYNQERGYCFVEYDTQEELEYTCNVLEGVRLYGRRIYLNRVERQTEVVVRNVGPELDPVFLWDVFSKFGPCHVEAGRDGKDICTITYRRRECAARAVETVNGKVIGNSRVSVEMRT